jgi:thiol-disulfide isomerase/thioredoxin
MSHTRKQHKHKPVIIGLVYADWCGHCNALKPEWEAFKTAVKKDRKLSNKCSVFEVEDSDSMKSAKLASMNKRIKGGEIQVNGFPTLFKISGGEVQYFQGGLRNAATLLEWAKQSSPYTGGKRKNKTANKSRKIYKKN